MIFKLPKNENYCASIVSIKNIVPLENCDNIQMTHIFGNPVIINRGTKIGDIGIYFPPETQLSHTFLKENNLFRHSEMNKNKEMIGYFGDNGRVKTMRFRGHQSCGLFTGLESLNFCGEVDYKLGDSFDEINSIEICRKYVIPKKDKELPGTKKMRKRIKVSKCIDGQFRFHENTLHLGKNLHRFSKNDMIGISQKLHGTSVVISNVLCKKKLNWFYKLIKKIGIKIIDKEYDNLYASRKIIKNPEINKKQGYYKEDVWGVANNKIKEFLLDGMTVYAEIVGFLSNGSYIQKNYDYGCDPNTSEVYIYRITYTNPSGNVFEFSHKQIKDWCVERNLKMVPELYYGRLKDIFINPVTDQYSKYYDNAVSFHENFFNTVKGLYLEKNCSMCRNKVPAEGVVVRKEGNNFEAYKLKSFRFLETESETLSRGEENIEDDQ